MDETTEEWITATQEVLQGGPDPLVTKPKLADKYLRKPPFRFLHDVITAVQAKTGFAPGLVSPEEVDARSIQDKEAKLQYLQKFIDCVSLVLDEPVAAKPKKIVAGQDAEHTCAFLRMLARASQKSDGVAAVQKILGSGAEPEKAEEPTRPAPSAPVEEPSPAPDPAPQPYAPPENETAASRGTPERVSSGRAQEQGEPEAARESEGKTGKTKTARQTSRKTSRSSRTSAEHAALPAGTSATQNAEQQPEPAQPDPRHDAGRAEGASTAAPLQQSVQMVRPQSAKKAPPRIRSSNGPRPESREVGSRGSSRAAAGTATVAPKLFEEGKADAADEIGETEVVQQEVVGTGAGLGAAGPQGALVKDMMEVQRAAEQQSTQSMEAAAGGAAAAAGGSGIVLRRRTKGTVDAGTAGAGKRGNLDVVKEVIQQLCKAANPLGKTLDFLTEDLENMTKEQRFWAAERQLYEDKLLDDAQLGVHDTAALEQQLTDLEEQIRRKRDSILGIKALLLQNDEKMQSLLGMVVGLS